MLSGQHDVAEGAPAALAEKTAANSTALRSRRIALAIRPETDVDYEATSKLAADAFDLPLSAFDPARMRWLYRDAFHHGSTIISAFAGEQKVGQVVLIHQRVNLDGEAQRAVALVDLFITKGHRSRISMAALYGAVERFCRDEGIRFIIGVPNEKGAKVNIHYLGLAQVLRLELRAGASFPRRAQRVVVSQDAKSLNRADAVALFSRYLPAQGAGMAWTPESLIDRLSGSFAPYAVHATQDLLMVSSIRVSRGMRHTLICGLFPGTNAGATKRNVAALTAAACLHHRSPAYVYVGVNKGVSLPGVVLPDNMRPSLMIVQMRDLQKPDRELCLDRFELVDFDLA